MFQSIQIAMYTPCTAVLGSIGTEEFKAQCNDNDQPYQRVLTVARKLQDSSKRMSGRANVLKIFLAPEWIFSRRTRQAHSLPAMQGFPEAERALSTRAYTQSDMLNAIEQLREISSRYPGILIIPGSILWFWLDTNSVQQLYNTVPVFFNGRMIKIYHKLHQAGDIDGDVPQNITMPFALNKNHREPPDIEGWRDNYRQQVTNDTFSPEAHGGESGLFTFGQLTIGLEVCRDSSESTLVRDYVTRDRLGMGLDIHIVLACGIPCLTAGSVAARQGGIAVLCDGARRHSEGNRRDSRFYRLIRRQGTVYDSTMRYTGPRSTVELEELQKDVYGNSVREHLHISDVLQLMRL